MDKYKDIISGIFAKYTNIDTSNAQGLIDELMQYKGHWSDWTARHFSTTIRHI